MKAYLFSALLLVCSAVFVAPADVLADDDEDAVSCLDERFCNEEILLVERTCHGPDADALACGVAQYEAYACFHRAVRAHFLISTLCYDFISDILHPYFSK